MISGFYDYREGSILAPINIFQQGYVERQLKGNSSQNVRGLGPLHTNKLQRASGSLAERIYKTLKSDSVPLNE